jgi:hypothetical protein
MVIKRYHKDGSIILSVKPDFEEQGLEQPPDDGVEGYDRYTEEYHLEGVAPSIAAAYQRIKQEISQIGPEIRVNP